MYQTVGVFLTAAVVLQLSACASLGAPNASLTRNEARSVPRGGVSAARLPPSDSLDADPDLAGDRRRLIQRSAETLEGQTADDAARPSDARLLAEIFGPLRLEDAPRGPGAPVERWAAVARERRGRPRIGDLALFRDTPGVPSVAIVLNVRPDGQVELLGSTRGAFRRIALHPERRSERRLRGRITNSFLRVKKRDDPPGTHYLAGQLLIGFRTLLD